MLLDTVATPEPKTTSDTQNLGSGIAAVVQTVHQKLPEMLLDVDEPPL